ncbi:hypothetical protein EDC94DRAFT_602359 [Helicostylum pulchrum]|nr:hypothetical protein EDC94DRAFT_602359 [Helicostylum pulchrum]
MASLFIGRLPRDDFDDRDLEELFYGFGKITNCKVKQGTRFGFGFVQFDNIDDAHYAIRRTDGLSIDGTRIVVERARNRLSNECYSCGEFGHRADDCRRRYRDYSRSSRDYHRSSRYSRSPSYDRYSRRSRSLSNSPKRRYDSRSPSPYSRRESFRNVKRESRMDIDQSSDIKREDGYADW